MKPNKFTKDELILLIHYWDNDREEALRRYPEYSEDSLYQKVWRGRKQLKLIPDEVKPPPPDLELGDSMNYAKRVLSGGETKRELTIKVPYDENKNSVGNG